jgi:lipopolysaccharide/colanic/teichoic acid biosynthesis glycosyltransferase
MNSFSWRVLRQTADQQELAPGDLVLVRPVPQAPTHSQSYTSLKRVLDMVCSGVALLMVLPLLLLIAIIIRLDSPGPALFRQLRVGKNGRLFTFYKFRTMYVDARERFPDLYAYAYTDDEIRTMCFKLPEDPRLTRFGRHLRKTSLDELPNFINVLRGDMSMVGPRPEIPEMLKYYSDAQLMKFSVTPGATGLAQTRGRGILTFQEGIRADLEYCQRRSFCFDVQICLHTIASVVRRVGAF